MKGALLGRYADILTPLHSTAVRTPLYSLPVNMTPVLSFAVMGASLDGALLNALRTRLRIATSLRLEGMNWTRYSELLIR